VTCTCDTGEGHTHSKHYAALSSIGSDTGILKIVVTTHITFLWQKLYKAVRMKTDARYFHSKFWGISKTATSCTLADLNVYQVHGCAILIGRVSWY